MWNVLAVVPLGVLLFGEALPPSAVQCCRTRKNAEPLPPPPPTRSASLATLAPAAAVAAQAWGVSLKRPERP